MKKIFDLYGIEDGELESVRKIIEAKLDIQFEPHESSYIGTYFRSGKPHGEGFILQNNFNQAENEWAEERYRSAKLILYVNQPSDPDGVKAKLISIPKVEFLIRQES